MIVHKNFPIYVYYIFEFITQTLISIKQIIEKIEIKFITTIKSRPILKAKLKSHNLTVTLNKGLFLSNVSYV
jgi:hypothetical protein